MKRTTRSFVGKVLRSGKRLFADRYEEELKQLRIISVAFVDTQVNKIKLLDHGIGIDNDSDRENFKLGIFKKVNVNRTFQVLRINEAKGGIELRESDETSLVADNHDDGGNLSRIKRFGLVYTRKRKRVLQTDAGFDEIHGSGELVVTKRIRSARKRIPRVSLFNSSSQTNGYVESTVPVPGVREVVGYAEQDYHYVPFMLPESYISARSDELSRTLETNYVVYDMDSDDEQWLKKFNHECVSADVFEKVIDAFERGIYCSPHDYSEAASAVDRCLGLASKEVLENVYGYWMTKRKKKRSALVRVFQCYKQKRVKQHFTSAVVRKKRSVRRRSSRHFAEKQLDFKKAMLNDEKLLEESTKANIKAHETQEAAKRSEEASIVKRQQAQALMEAADLAVYRATMALRIAEALAAGGLVEPATGATIGYLVE